MGILAYFVWLSSALLPAQKTLAYLDPGSGSFLIQLLIGGLAGIAIVVKTYWKRIKAFFSRASNNPGTDNDTADAS